MHPIRNEKGIALAVAIVALVTIGALVAAAFFVGMQEERVGRNTVGLQRALSAAEQGAAIRVADWQPMVTNYMAVGDSLPFGGTLPGNTGWYRGFIYRLDNLLYLVTSEGFSPDSQARQSVGVLARPRPVEIDVKASLETQGKTTVSGNKMEIKGADHIPPGWSGCSAPTDTLAGIRIAEADSVVTNGGPIIEGQPAIEEDPSIDGTTLTTFGDATFADLVALANKWLTNSNMQQVQPSAVGGDCDMANLYNWGEPARSGSGLVPACNDYFPVVYSPTDLTVNGRRGQGVLIVNGNLAIGGGFEFNGPVIVRGKIEFLGNGNHVYGGVIAANVIASDNNALGGTNTIYYSKCAIEKALSGGSVAWPLQERSWVNLY